jgi:hypothetical protein
VMKVQVIYETGAAGVTERVLSVQDV